MRLCICGSILTLLFWILAWMRVPLLSENSFFPLWLGYILTVNGVSEVLFHTSLLRRMKASFIWIFIVSIPLWWYFEWYNSVLQNWHYILLHPISHLEYTIRASINFSTVVPAVVSTAFLSKLLIQKIAFIHSKKFTPSPGFLIFIVLLGIFSLIGMWIYPHQAFPLLWLGLFFILEPVNYFLGRPSIVKQLQEGKPTDTLVIMLATLFTGFWWEMWNFYSMPKWYYTIPYIGFDKVFEMPIVGYLGYPFFGLEIFAYISLLFGKDLLP